MRASIILLIAATTAGGCVVRPPAAPRGDAESPFARTIVAALSSAQTAGVDGEPVDVETLRRVYADRRHAPLWIDDSGRIDARADAIAAVLTDAASEGLDPRDYHAGAIGRRLATRAPDDAVPLELLLSDGVIRYAIHQTSGVRPPAPRDPEAWLEHADPDAGLVAREVADAPDAGARLRDFAPAHASYRRLRDALAVHRRIAADGGWPMVPDKHLPPGQTDPAVWTLQRRLAISGDLEAAEPSRHYDDAAVTAVRRFQWRHGIGPDGVAGPRTVAALNVPVARRTEEIIANLERWRWLGRDLAPEYVKVNVPDFSLELVRDGSAVLTMPVVVGKTDWRTPTLSSAVRRVIFNPSWSVPRSIADKEILPKARGDAGYLRRQGFVAKGERLRQPPGPQNPLGRVKFELPNPYGVYLHDTPSRRGFTRTNRALSHGCIRLGDPFALADALLATTDGWSAERRARILSTWKTQSFALADPVPIYVLYATAWVDELGALHFRDDVYERDQALRRLMADAGRAPLAARSSQRRSREPAVALP